MITLPAILPIVLYNGKRRWTAPTQLSHLIEKQAIPDDYLPHFQYLLIDENRYSRQHLLTIRNIVSTLFLAETHYEIELLEQELFNLYRTEQDKAAVSLFLNWFKQLAIHGRIDPTDYDQLNYVYQSQEEVQTMLVATLQQERQNIFQAGRTEGQQLGLQEGLQEGLQQGLQKGLQQGLQKGLQQGRVQERREMLLHLASLRFAPSETELQAITHYLNAISDLDLLGKATTFLLGVSRPEPFITHLQQLANKQQP